MNQKKDFMKNYIATFLTIATFMFAADSQIDLNIDTQPSDLQKKSCFNVTSTTSNSNERHAVLLSPEMTFYTNGNIDFSATATHRHRLFQYVVGHSLFFDRSTVGPLSLDQMGTGLDFLTTRFEARVNYYHPITYGKKIPVRSAKWVDSEVFFKTRYFGVGTGPVYNIDMDAWSLHSRLVVPMKTCSFTIGGLFGDRGFAHALFSVSFHLFKPKNDNLLISPPSHTSKSNIYYQSKWYVDQKGNIVDLTDPRYFDYIEQVEDEITSIKKIVIHEEKL